VNQLEKMNIKIRLNKERKEYCNNWEISSCDFLNGGIYEWCEDIIKDKHCLFEIGVGTGISSKFLIEKGHRIFGIEENPECIKKCKETLSDNDVRIIERGEETTPPYSNYYEMEYHDFQEELDESQSIIIESDFMMEDVIPKKFPNIKFDAIICWFIGVHNMMGFNFNQIQRYRTTDTVDKEIYRQTLQCAIFEVADKYLNKNGIINLVDRGIVFKDKEKEEEWVKDYSERFIGDHPFEIVDFQSLVIDNPNKVGDGIKYHKKNKSGEFELVQEDKIAIFSMYIMKK